MPKVATKPEEEKIPRPPNRWILYRQEKVKELAPPPGAPRKPQAEISKLISLMWAQEPESVKLEFEQKAVAAKLEHARLYPQYQYMPEKKDTKIQKRKLKKEQAAKERQAAKEQKRGRFAPYTTRPYDATPHQLGQYASYPPEVTYGPGGPSPPLSAASTPELATSSLPSVSSSHVSPVALTSHLPAISPPTNVYPSDECYMPTPVSPPSHGPKPSATAAALFASEWRPVPVQAESSSSSHANPDLALSVPATSENTAMDHANPFSASSYAVLQGWADGGDDCLEDGEDLRDDDENCIIHMNPRTHPSLFDMNMFYQGELINQPEGQVDAALATMPPIDAGSSIFTDAGDLLRGFTFENFDASALDMLSMPDMTYDLYSPVDSVPPSATSDSAYFLYPQGATPTSAFPEQSPVDQLQIDQMLQYVNIADDGTSNEQTLEEQQQLLASYASQFPNGVPMPILFFPPPPPNGQVMTTVSPAELQLQQGQVLLPPTHPPSTAPTPAPAIAAQPTLYAPPAGAAKTGASQLAASWKQVFAGQPSPVAGSPSDPQPPWGTLMPS